MCWEMCLWCKQIIFGQIIAIQYNVPFSCFWIKGWLPLTSIKQGSPENQQEKHNLKWERESKAAKDSSLLPTNSQKKFQFEESDKHAWQWGLQRTWFFFFFPLPSFGMSLCMVHEGSYICRTELFTLEGAHLQNCIISLI